MFTRLVQRSKSCRWGWIIVCLLLLGLGGKGDPPSIVSAEVSLSGTWSGVIKDIKGEPIARVNVDFNEDRTLLTYQSPLGCSLEAEWFDTEKRVHRYRLFKVSIKNPGPPCRKRLDATMEVTEIDSDTLNLRISKSSEVPEKQIKETATLSKQQKP